MKNINNDEPKDDAPQPLGTETFTQVTPSMQQWFELKFTLSNSNSLFLSWVLLNLGQLRNERSQGKFSEQIDGGRIADAKAWK